MRKRGLRSPDEWDSLALTFAAPVIVTSMNVRRTARVGMVA